MSADNPHAPPGSRGGSSFAEIAFRQHRGALQHFLIRRLHNRENARDLAQEVYLRLLRVEDGELIRSPLAYLYRLAMNVVYEFKLRVRRDPVGFDSETADELVEHPLQETSSADAYEQLCTEQELRSLLAPLPPVLRAVFVLRKRDGMTHQEIAAELGLSAHTVKKYLCQAVAYCRTAIQSRQTKRLT